VFSTLLIALREGLEAALIISALLAYLSKIGRRELARQIWLGVAGAITLSLGLGALLNFTNASLGADGEQWFAGLTSIFAVALVTAMVFWMKRAARHITSELRAKVDAAIPLGSGALIATAFFAVAREGLETALFLFTNFRTATSAHQANYAPAIGLVAGLATAVAIGRALYRRTLHLNLGRFFTITGIALIIVAAGVLVHGLGEFQSLGLLKFASGYIWNLPGGSSGLATFLDGTFGFGYQLTWLQGVIWLIYTSLVLTRYLKPTSNSKSVQLASNTAN
jgi:high-affinity iron transporter